MQISYKYTKKFPDFQVDLTNQLGKGATSFVYKAFYNVQSKFVAAKLFKQIVSQTYFDREIQILQKLTKIRNPYLITYYGFRKTQMGIFLLLQYCKGGTLASYLKNNKKVSELKVMKFFGQILQAMTALHQEKIIHRDLKSENILLNENDCIKIADYGWARQMHENMTRAMTNSAGTPVYSSPQILFQRNYNQKTDVWSAGLILYEMLMGSHYFDSINSMQKLKKQVQKFKQKNHTISYPEQFDPEWAKITSKMLNYDPYKRSSFAQLLKYFKNIEEQLFDRLSLKYQSLSSKKYRKNIQKSRHINPNQLEYVRPPPLNNPEISPNEIQQKIKHENSYFNYTNLAKYFYFIEEKYNFVLHILTKQKLSQYQKIPNTEKYILWFLLLAIYISKLTQILQQIRGFDIFLPDRRLRAKDFSSAHMQTVKALLQEKTSKYQQQIKKYQQYLSSYIIKQIQSYQEIDIKNSQISELSLACGADLFKLVAKTKPKADKSQMNFDSYQYYLMILKKIIDSQPAYLIEFKLQQLQIHQKQAYLLLRTIGHIHQIFNEKKYQEDDYIIIQKKEILKKKNNKQQLEMILKYNK